MQSSTSSIPIPPPPPPPPSTSVPAPLPRTAAVPVKTMLPTWYKRGLSMLVSSILFAYASYCFYSVELGAPNNHNARLMQNVNRWICWCLGFVCSTLSFSAFCESWWMLTNKKVRDFDFDENSGHIATLVVNVLTGIVCLFCFFVGGIFTFNFDTETSEEFIVQKTMLTCLFVSTLMVGFAVVFYLAREFIVDSYKAIGLYISECAKMPYQIVSILIAVPFEQTVEAIVEKKIA